MLDLIAYNLAGRTALNDATRILSGHHRGVQRLADGSVGYSTRGHRTDDCFASALATVLQVPIEELPDPRIDDRLAAGERPEEINRSAWLALHGWLADRGLRMVVHQKLPPRRRRWIGVVPIRGWFQSHCLVMSYNEVLFDPVQGKPYVPPPWEPPLLDAQTPFGLKARHVRYGLSFQSAHSRA